MISPRVRSGCWSTSALFVIISFSCPSSAIAQVPDTEVESGIALYEKREYQQARDLVESAVRRNKSDLIAWRYLALVYEDLGKKGDARKAYERAATLGESLLLKHLSDPRSADPLAQLLPLFTQIDYAAGSARKYISLSPNLFHLDFEEWTNRAVALQEFAEILKPDGLDQNAKLFAGQQVTAKARILSKQEPQYTDEARASHIKGRVILLLILAADGKVKGVIPVKRLSHGLTEAAVRVARQIGFLPAQINGKPVSMLIKVEYFFDFF